MERRACQVDGTGDPPRSTAPGQGATTTKKTKHTPAPKNKTIFFVFSTKNNTPPQNTTPPTRYVVATHLTKHDNHLVCFLLFVLWFVSVDVPDWPHAQGHSSLAKAPINPRLSRPTIAAAVALAFRVGVVVLLNLGLVAMSRSCKRRQGSFGSSSAGLEQLSCWLQCAPRGLLNFKHALLVSWGPPADEVRARNARASASLCVLESFYFLRRGYHSGSISASSLPRRAKCVFGRVRESRLEVSACIPRAGRPPSLLLFSLPPFLKTAKIVVSLCCLFLPSISPPSPFFRCGGCGQRVRWALTLEVTPQGTTAPPL